MAKLRQSGGGIAIPLPWETVSGSQVSETAFLDALRQLPRDRLLVPLIKLLQHIDAPVQPKPINMDGSVPQLFPGALGRRAYDHLKRSNRLIFFSTWQLLFAIKLLCTFGSKAPEADKLDPVQTLKLLLMVNSFYPDDPSSPSTEEDAVKQVQSVALRGYALPHYERPSDLIVRYATMYGEIAAPTNRETFRTWVNVKDVLAAEMGVDIDVFKAVLFAIFANATPVDYVGNGSFPFGALDPTTYFAVTQLPHDELTTILDWVTITPDEIGKKHRSVYGETIGNPADLADLLRKPVMRLADGRLAGLSGELVVQRYTSGLYWDINDALPSDSSRRPNRGMFWTFFGELHERYGQDLLRRIVSRLGKAGKNAALLSEQDYASVRGRTPDNVLVEAIGAHNVRATLFEFKVGRPRYYESIVKGNVDAFSKDLQDKIESGLDQEINLLKQLLSGTQPPGGLPIENVSKWFFVIVVTDPYPATGLFLGPLRQKLAEAGADVGAKLYGPFILCLSELEQLEALSEKRVSDLLIDWAIGPDKEWPFTTFFFNRTKGRPLKFDRLAESAREELHKVSKFLFPFDQPINDTPVNADQEFGS